jgi:hypothetical protein
MFRQKDPASSPHFQIDPDQRPLFQIFQSADGGWVEVGYVWTEGTSRTSSTEHWFLFASVKPGSTAQAAYRWAGFDGREILGTTLRFVPASPPEGEAPATFRAHLERELGVTVTYVKGEMSG